MSESSDVAIVGSGPSGSLAADRLLAAGLRVAMLDVANDDDRYRKLIPDQPFWEIRASDPEQRRYFLGDELEGVPTGDVRVGAQLTPPRQFVTRDSERLLRVTGDDFEPMQSLALGGLGAAWGAASFTYTPDELERIGIRPSQLSGYYDAVARRIGVSGEPGDDASEHCFQVTAHQPPLELDAVAKAIWAAYGRRRAELRRAGLSLGRTPLAVLTRDLGERRANPLFDMDFWGDSRRSVFRPRYLVEELLRNPRFRLVRGTLVRSFRDEQGGVEVEAIDASTGEPRRFRARRLMLCAGAINSARLALHALGLHDVPVPMLCNPYRYLPCFALRMLGHAADDRRHSLSQLVALYAPPDDPGDVVPAQMYGYRSLLLFKLVKEMPLPPWAGLQVARLLMNALCIVGIHHSDAPHAGKTLRVRPPGREPLPVVHFEYAASDSERSRRRERERALVRLLRRLGLLPYARIDPGPASSIHYAGTLPMGDGDAPFGTHPDGRLRGAPRVYVGDSTTWRYLPAKGLTFTIMANALRVADHVVADLGERP